MDEDVKKFLEEFARESDRRKREAMLQGRLMGMAWKEQEKFTKQLKIGVETRKKSNTANKKSNENLKNFSQELSSAEKGLNKFNNEMEAAREVISPFISTIAKVGDASGEGAKNLSTLSGMFKNFGMTGGILQSVAESFDYTLDTFEELSQVGAQFANDMLAMRQAAVEARLPLSEFAGLVANNAGALATLFRTTEDGVQRLIGFTKGVRDAAGEEGLFGLGITVEELNEYLGTYLERERFRGRMAQISQQEVVTRTIAYAKELDLLAKITGVQRKQMDEDVKAQQVDAVFQRALRGMNADQRDQANLLVAALKNVNPELAEQAKSLIATGIGFGDFGQLLMGTNPELVEILKNFKGLVSSGKSATDIMGMLGSTGRNFNDNFPDPEIFRFGAQGFADVGNAMEALALITGEDIEVLKERQKRQSQLNKLLGPFREEMRKLQSAFEDIKVDFLQMLVPFIKTFTEFLKGPFKGIIERVGQIIENFDGEKLGKWIVGALAATILFDTAKQIGIVTAGTAAGIKLAGGFGGMGGGMGGMMGKAGMILGGTALAASGAGLAETAEGPVGKLAGITAGAGGGALTGAQIGMFLGPKGALIGSILGALAGGGYAAYKGFFDENSRAIGTMSTLGLSAEPKDTIAKIHKGERVLNQNETMAYNNQNTNALNDAVNNLIKTNVKMEQHLNTLVTIGAMTERNTKNTQNNLANMSGSII